MKVLKRHKSDVIFQQKSQQAFSDMVLPNVVDLTTNIHLDNKISDIINHQTD